MALTKEQREQLRKEAATTQEQVEQYLKSKAELDSRHRARDVTTPPDPSEYVGRPKEYAEARRAYDEAVRQQDKDKQDARQEARALAEQKKMKTDALRNYTQAGGLAKDFESQWPKIRDQLLLERTVSRMGAGGVRRRYKL